MRIYIDACCLNRPFDDQSQDRIRLECEAVRSTLQMVEAGEHIWVASDVLTAEIRRHPHEQRRIELLSLVERATEHMALTLAATKRANDLVSAGFGSFDALHFAVGEEARCDILLTTDDDFVRRAARLRPLSPTRVVNPAHWLMEQTDGDETT